MSALKHSPDCSNKEVDYFTSDCMENLDCAYYIEAVQECKSTGEHFRRIVSDGGYDICHNCGVKA